MTNLRRSLLLSLPPMFLLGGVAVARVGGDTAPSHVQLTSSPAGPGARFPTLARSQDGRIAMIWSEKGADSVTQVRVSVRDASGQWSSPSTVVRDTSLLVNFADVPRIAWLSRNELAVTWLKRGGPGRYDYGVRVARSNDAGRSWQRLAPPHDSTEAGEHGFVSLVPLSNARFAMTFLNGHSHGTPGGGTQVVMTEYDAKGERARTLPLDTRACDCCQTAATVSSRGVLVVYRDRTQDEIRDISITREVNGKWTDPAPVSKDRWKIGGCPVNGPAISSDAQRVVVAWFTGARDTAKVQVAFSNDGGVTFGAPMRSVGGAPAGHVDVLMQTNGSAIVSWLERGEGDKLSVRLRRVSPNRTTSTPVVLGEVQGIRPTGWPSIVENNSGVLVAWTVPGSPARIQLQQVSKVALQ